MMDGIRIRELRADDAEEKANLISLVNYCYRGTGNWTNEMGIVTGARLTADELEEDLRIGTVLVAIQSDSRVVGSIKLNVTLSTLIGLNRSFRGTSRFWW